MKTILIIDQDRHAAHQLALTSLDRGIGAALVETLCDGVRLLLTESVSLVVIESSLIRIGPRELAILLDRIAPGVPVVVATPSHCPLDVRVGWELAGLAVVSHPVLVEDLLKITAR